MARLRSRIDQPLRVSVNTVGIPPQGGAGAGWVSSNEFWNFLKQRKKFWLFPILFVMVIFGG